jgi:hypothetical protein
MITFFEDWQNHMTVTGTSSVNSSNYFYRMRYPSDYKCDTMFITKFEKDYGINGYGPLLQYQFLKVFPLNLSAVPISYGDSDIMKVTVEFSYDRYLMKNNGLGADDGIRPSQTGQNMITGSTTSSAAAASAPTAIKDDLAAWALSNEKMISSQTVTSSGNYLQDQKDILASAKAAYPPGSPQLKQLQQKYGF